MLVRNKLLLSSVIGIGSVLVLILIAFFHNKLEKERAYQVRYMSQLSELYTVLEEELLEFVIVADSGQAMVVRSALQAIENRLRERPESMDAVELDDVNGALRSDYEIFEALVLRGDYVRGWPASRDHLVSLRMRLLQTRNLLHGNSLELVEGVFMAEQTQSRIILIFIMPALLIAVTLIFLTSRDLIDKIDRLLEDTARIEKGDFSHRVAVKSDDELGRISEAVNRVADSLNDARMKEQNYRNDLLKRTDQLNLLKELAIVANRIHNVNELYRIVLERLRSYTGWMSAHVYVLSRNGREMVPSGLWSFREKSESAAFVQLTNEMVFMKNEGLIGRVFASGKPEWLKDTHDSSLFLRAKASDISGIRTVAAFPVNIGDRTEAIIELHNDKREKPDNDLTDLFKGVAALISHVIARERYVSKLNLQTEQLNYAMVSAGMYSWNIDLESGEPQLSRNYKNILGFTEGRTGDMKEFQDHIHPDDRGEVVKSFGELFTSHKSFSREFRFIGDDGMERCLWSKGDVVYDLDGNPEKIAGIVMDITGRKKIESLLEASEKNYRLLFENSPLPLWIFTKRTLSVVDANSTMEKMFGYDKPVLQRTGIQELVHEDDFGTVRESFRNMHQSPYVELEARIKTAEGSWLETQIYASGITYNEEDCIIATCTDITELKLTRKRLLGSIIEGEDRERRRVAVELHDGIGQYLTATNLNLEALKKDLEKLPPKKYQQFMNGLVLLSMAIDETRNLAHTLMPKALSDYGLVVSLKSLIEKLKRTAIPDIFFYTSIDENRLNEQTRINIYRVIQEAMSNALRHSKGTRIDVQAVMHNDTLVILIEDNGVGFDPDIALKKSGGIGLQSIKNRIVSLNGNIEIDSVQGRGTSITIEIPLIK
jgi:PAS domain S-box-containing protein